MPLGNEVHDYESLAAHVDKLHLAVQSEKWLEVENLWFDRYALHKTIPALTTVDKLRIQAIISRMDEINGMLGERRKDIGLLLRIPS